MKKIVIHKPGGYNRLVIETHPVPEPGPGPGPGEVLVETAYCGVNYADCCVRWGVYESAKEYVGWPITPGFEFSGQVTAIGEEVRGFKAGDQVFGVTRFGGYASHVTVPAHQLWTLPEALSLEEAAAFPAVFLTAFHALKQNIRLRPGSHILVHSAAGGVGSALVQLAHHYGHQVTGVVGASHKVTALEELGCDRTIDKSTDDLWKQAERHAPGGYDAIFDANGYQTFRGSYRHLAPTGKLVVYGSHTLLPKRGGRINYLKAVWGLWRTPRFNPLALISENRSVVGFNLSFLFERRDLLEEGMDELIRLLNQGAVIPPTVTSYAFEQVAEAHQAIESGQTVGKLALRVF